MKQAFNIGDFVEIIGGEWDGGRGTVRTVYDDGYKIYLGPKDGEVKVYPPITTRLPLADTEIKTPGVTLKRLARREKQGFIITEQGLSLTPGVSPDKAEIELCKEWLQNYVTKRKNINKLYSSQRLGYKVSKWANNRPVSNGAFIQAAIELGYRCEQSGEDDKAASFNMALPPRGTKKYREAFPDKRG